MPVSSRIEDALRNFRQKGHKLVFITGAPIHHVPLQLFGLAEKIFVEQGGLKWKNNEVSAASQTKDIYLLRDYLGIRVEDGLQRFNNKTLIVEGMRYASLTLLFGSPAHYHGLRVTADPEEILAKIQDVILEKKLELFVVPGHDEEYSWIDVAVTNKTLTVQKLLTAKNPVNFSKVYYLGDGGSDFGAMSLDGVIPVGFPNCISSIISLTKSRGIFIPKKAYEYGTKIFFSRLLDGEF